MSEEETWQVMPKGRFEQFQLEGMDDQEALLQTMNWMFEKIDKLEQQMTPLAEQFLELEEE